MTFRRLTIQTVITITMVLAGILFLNDTFAAPAPTINYQGKLTDATGLAVPNGTYNMRFYLYNTTGGATTTAIWNELLTGSNQVQVTNGLFSVMLGSTTPLTSVDFNQVLYLGVEIGGTGTPNWDGEMTPRKELGTVPAAFEAFKLGGVASSSFLRSDQADAMSATSASTLLSITQSGAGGILSLFNSGGQVFSVNNDGSVGIGTTTAARLFNVAGAANAGARFTDTTNAVKVDVRSEDFQGFIGTFSNHDLRLITNNASRLTITAAGDVGIGTTNPSAKLAVLGQVKANYFTGTSTASSTFAGGLVTSGALAVNGVSTSTFANGIQLSAGCFRDSTGNCVGGGAGADGKAATYVVAAYNSKGKAYADYVADFSHDEVEINAAIAAAYTTSRGAGGAVYLLEGDYTVGTTSPNTSSIIMATGTSLLGAGIGTNIILASSTPGDLTIISGDGVSGVTLANFAIDGNSANQSYTADGVGLNLTSSSTITGLYIHHLPNNSSGISLYNSTLNRVSDNTVIETNRDGIYISNSHANAITGNILRHNTNTGIELYNAYQNTIIGNLMDSNSSGFVFNNSYQNTLTGNTVTDSYAAEASIGSISNEDGNTVSGNTFVYNNSGLKLESVGGTTITGNTFSDTYSTGGLFLVGASRGVISGNTFTNNGDTGASSTITLISADDNVISSNNITDTAGTGYAIDITSASSERNTLVGNSYSGTGAKTIRDLGTNTHYTEWDRLTLDTRTLGQVAYSPLSIFASSSVALASTTQLGSGKLISLNNSSGEMFTVANNGNVGIGTSSPMAKLSVVGQVMADYFTANSSSVFSTFTNASISHLETGSMAFPDDGGVITWADMGVTSGAAAGTTERYSANLDGVALLTLSGLSMGDGTVGSTTVHIGSSTPFYSSNIPDGSLIVGNGIICVDDGSQDCDNAARTRGYIYAQNAGVTGIDLAEQYPTTDETLSPGELVMLDIENETYVKRYASSSDSSTKLIGVISTKPGVLLGGFGTIEDPNVRRVAVALSGRVPVLITGENGPVQVGDRITTSKVIPGYGAKANESSPVTVAIALENWTGGESETGQIMAFMNLDYHAEGRYFTQGANGQFSSLTDQLTIETVGSGQTNGNVNNSSSDPSTGPGTSNTTNVTQPISRDRLTLDTRTLGQVGYSPLSIFASSSVALVEATQMGTGPVMSLRNKLGEIFAIANNGNVGIGTPASNAKFSVVNRAFSGAGVVGLDQLLETKNNVASAIQYGNRFRLEADNSTTTTIIGSGYNIEDNTDFGNTVRGLEVMSNSGSNTAGENTAISGYGGTFGVRGVTSGVASERFEPAGGYFESEGTVHGNVIRAYSDTVTTATLVSLFQSTSNFTGTGLEMNFGNSDGTFSGATAKYLDFKNNGLSVLTVSAFGNTVIGDGIAGHQAGLEIGNGGLCVDNDGSCTASTSGRISAVDMLTGNSDLAEVYFSSADLEPGEIVSLEDGLSINRAIKNNQKAILGVISTKPGLTLGYDDKSLKEGETAFPVALAGRVPVRLSTEGGPIVRGDQLMLSSLPGVAMKATGTGATIGIALEDFDDTRMYSDTYINQFGDDIVEPVFEPIEQATDSRINDGCYQSGGEAIGEKPCVPLSGTSEQEIIAEANSLAEQEARDEALQKLAEEPSVEEVLNEDETVKVGQVVMFVKSGYRWVNNSQEAALGTLVGTSTLTNLGADENETIFDRLVKLANNFVDGVLSILEIRVDRIEVADELCVDGVCLTADDLRNLLKNQPAASAGVEPPVTSEEPEVVVTPPADEESLPAAEPVGPDPAEEGGDQANDGTAAEGVNTPSAAPEPPPVPVSVLEPPANIEPPAAAPAVPPSGESNSSVP